MMKREIMLTALFLPALIFGSSYKCGPDNLCECQETRNNNTEINCTDSKLTLSVVCDYVRTKNITRVILLRYAFTAINATDLQGCEDLKSLDLQHGNLATIQDNAFERLKNLQVLVLSHNNLSSLYNKNVTCRFTHLTRLKSLYLNGNIHITYLKDGSYPNLTCLPSLTTLRMDSTSGFKFGPEFERLQTLHTVSLSGFHGFCNMQRVENSSFAGLGFVRNLSISKCNVTGFEADAIQHLRYLEVFDISFNQHLGFSILPNVSYGLQFTNISVLNVSHVFPTFGIGTTLEKRHLCYLWNTSLKELDLSSNRLQIVETNALILLSKSLEKFHGNDNIFTFGLYLLQLACVDKLREIYLNREFSSHPIPRYIKEDNITYHNKDGVGCPFMEDAFLDTTSRSINGCRFMDPKKNNFDFFNVPKNLRKIEYSSCRLEYELRSLTPHNILEYVDLSGNIFDVWEGPIALSSATYLDLSNNFCSYMSQSFFKSMVQLQNLQVQNNFLGLMLNRSSSNLELFKGLDSLKTINMSSNRIRSLPTEIFHQLKSIEIIDLSKNSLQELDIEFESLRNVSYLDVSYNALPNLPLNLLNHLSGVSERRNISFKVDLTENTLLLSCKDTDFLNFLLKYKNNFNNFDKYLFQDENGKQTYGYELQERVKSLTKSCHNYTYVIVACCAAVLIFITVVIIGLIYKHRWKLRFLLHMAKRRYFRHEQLLLDDDQDADDIDTDMRYEAFISYAEEDIQFVRRGIIPQLEDNGVRLCIHQRDFIAGKPISDNIVDAIHDSRKTVVILSTNYVRRQWCMYEFHMARMQNIYHRNNSLIIVMLEHVNVNLMPLEMIAWLDTESYLEYTTDPDGEVLFWNRLRANINV